MAQQDISMGPEALVDVNDEEYVWIGGNLSVNWKEHDTNDSSDALSDQFRGGRRRLMCEANAHSEKGRNIHAGPYNVGNVNDEFVDIKFWPNGKGNGETPYHAPTWLRSSVRVEMPVKQGDPVTVAISGGSSGTFYLPGES